MENTEKRNSFIFYRSFYEAINELSDEQQGRVYSAIFRFALNGEEPELTGVEKAIFTLVKPQLEANNTRFENGARGGRPRKNTETETEPNHAETVEKQEETETERKPKQNRTETEQKPKQNQNKTETKPNGNQTETEPKPNVNVNVNVNDNVNVNGGVENRKGVVGGKEREKTTQQTGKPSCTPTHFLRPTVEEVAEYCAERKNGVDAQRFVDFYASKGWLIGKNPMKDWRACVRTWEREERERQRNGSTVQPQGRTYTDLDRLFDDLSDEEDG